MSTSTSSLNQSNPTGCDLFSLQGSVNRSWAPRSGGGVRVFCVPWIDNAKRNRTLKGLRGILDTLLRNYFQGGLIPSSAEEGWLRHQANVAKPPLMAQTGWCWSRRFYSWLNEPPRPRRIRCLRDIFVDGAATPPSPRRGIRLTKPSSSLETGRQPSYVLSGCGS